MWHYLCNQAIVGPWLEQTLFSTKTRFRAQQRVEYVFLAHFPQIELLLLNTIKQMENYT